MRQIGDPEADHVVESAFREARQKELYGVLAASEAELRKAGSGSVREFLLQPGLFPEWYDADRLLRGQQFFKKYALEIMTLLGALSLPYCYAASPGNKALYFTGKMQQKPGKRLHDTAHFIIEVLNPESFGPGGAGPFEVQRTRLVHALVRHYVGGRTDWKAEWGVPVNQEDMAGTNLAFSHIVLKGLGSMNFRTSAAEKEDFLYAWRFIGHQLRIDESLLPASSAEANQLERVIKARHFRLSDEAKLLTRELLQHYREAFPAVAAYLIESQIRYFVGPEVSVLLGLKPKPFRDQIVHGINLLQRRINKRFVNPYSYDMMIRNHRAQQKKYS